MNDGDNDGLLGPRPFVTEPTLPPGPGPGEGPSSPGMRGHFSARNSFTQQPGQQQDPSQDLSRSRERPPSRNQHMEKAEVTHRLLPRIGASR
jgi:hypothetical protein